MDSMNSRTPACSPGESWETNSARSRRFDAFTDPDASRLGCDDGGLCQIIGVVPEDLCANQALMRRPKIHQAHDAAMRRATQHASLSEVFVQSHEHALLALGSGE